MSLSLPKRSGRRGENNVDATPDGETASPEASPISPSTTTSDTGGIFAARAAKEAAMAQELESKQAYRDAIDADTRFRQRFEVMKLAASYAATPTDAPAVADTYWNWINKND